MKNISLILIIVIGLTACKKEAGEGGTSVIEGKVIYFQRTFNTVTSQTDTHEYPKSGKDVFIIYSDDEGEVYDADFETDYNGKYRFEFLRKGDYTIYTHKDTSIVIGFDPIDNEPITYEYDLPIYKHIKIKSNNSVNIVNDFLIENN